MHRKGRAVVIDDDLMLCRYFEHVLQRAGMDVQCTQTGADGLAAVRSEPPDIVLLDVHLPDEDGFSVCQQLKADPHTEGVAVLVVSASPDTYIDAFRAGAADCLAKPVSGSELTARVAKVMAGKTRSEELREMSNFQRLDAQRDVTSHMEHEQERMQQAISAMDRTIGILGHELRTPLAGLRVMSEFLLTNPNQRVEAEHFVQAIHDEVLRLSDMVNNLLESARINSGEARWRWQDVSVLDVCEGAITLLSALGSPDVKIVCDVQPEDMIIRGDADALRRLVLNLLSNAQKHTKAGTISVHARLHHEANEQWFELVVADTGSGIPREVMEALGVPFALNRGAVGDDGNSGVGLGLSICKSIASVHGGDLTIHSEIGQGTIVKSRLRADLECAVSPNANHLMLEVSS